jgi:hypothetical protein
MLTRSNVAYDLNISPHKHTVDYGDFTIMYVFSSDLYKRKFIEKIEEHRKTISDSLSNRFGFMIVLNKLADIKLYTTIEKRGFLLYNSKGEKLECQSNIILDGEILMNVSLNE